MNIALSPGSRRTIALSGALIVLAMLWQWALVPLANLTRSAVEQMRDAQFELAQATRAANERNSVSAAEVAQAEETVTQILFAGDSEGAVTSAMQNGVTRIFSEVGLTMESMSARAGSNTGPVSRVAIEGRARGTEKAAMSAVAAIEGHRPLLVIERLVMVVQNPNAQDQEREEVVLELRLVGLWARPREGSGTRQ